MSARKYLRRKVVAFDPLVGQTTDGVVSQLSRCSFQGRNLAYALDVWEAMCRDRGCLRVLSLAGALVPAGMALLIMRLIEKKLVSVIVCTGATVSHDMCNSVAQGDQAHFIGNELEDDLALRNAAINRIYDTYLSETDFQRAEKAMLRILPKIKFDRTDDDLRTITTSAFLRQVGNLLPGRSIITTAAEHGVPIFVPAISDSEMGLNVVIGNHSSVFGQGKRMIFDTLGDVEHFASLVTNNGRAGLVSIGGGVPRNWSQQVYPYLNMKAVRRWTKSEGYHYGVRITTDRPEFGGMSGCTISESKSWGKYETQAVETSLICDATIALPILTSALFERLGLTGKKRAKKK